MRIAFLGLGQMGTGIAALMVKQGHDVTAWNRTPKALEGATVAASAAEAVRDAEAVFSMLFGDQAVDDIFFGEQLLDAIPKGAIHVGLSTISVALAGRLHEEHSAHGQHYVGSPVFGRPSVAAEGKLWIIVAGAGAAITTVRPVLEQFSRGITVLGEDPSSAHALKLGGNFLITAMIAALSEGATYAEGHGIDAATYLEAVNSALFQSPFYAAYSKVMLNPPETAGATLELGQKDMRLFRESAGDVQTPLADMLQRNLDQAVDSGHGKEDWAAGYYAQVVRASRPEPAAK
jgi:3-hydroxyisobutyrate dehydrogenase-like beta-hydroxyacid dehydrogenase